MEGAGGEGISVRHIARPAPGFHSAAGAQSSGQGPPATKAVTLLIISAGTHGGGGVTQGRMDPWRTRGGEAYRRGSRQAPAHPIPASPGSRRVPPAALPGSPSGAEPLQMILVQRLRCRTGTDADQQDQQDQRDQRDQAHHVGCAGQVAARLGVQVTRTVSQFSYTGYWWRRPPQSCAPQSCAPHPVQLSHVVWS